MKTMDQKRHLLFANRVYRLRDAPRYLGMDVHRFNKEVRPYLTEIPIGKQGKGFDVLEMDAWLEHYISRNGRPAKLKGDLLWDAKKSLDFKNDLESGTLIKKSVESEFVKVLEQVCSKKRKGY